MPTERLRVTVNGQTRHLALGDREVRLGSGSDNDLVIALPSVSRRHAVLRPIADGWWLEDLGSKNGMVAAGRRESLVQLRTGLAVHLGKAIVEIESVSTSEAEVALSLPAVSRPQAAATPEGNLDEHPSEPASASPAAALRLVRDWETSRGDERPFVRRALEVLGAESLLRFQVGSPGDAIIQDCEGFLPSEACVAALAAEAHSGHSDLLAAEACSGPVLLASGPSGVFLAALFPPGPPPEAWRQDFFDFLAVRIFGAAPTSPRPKHALADEALQLPDGMVVGPSSAMAGLMAHFRATVKSDRDVLLSGDTGTGKELFARLIHASGPMACGPFVAINCAAISAELLEAELFGVGARVATGVDPRPGLFLKAQNGTLFLDEIGELHEHLQAKLLRVLQEREVLPVGATAPKKIHVRVISASNRDLAAQAREGTFRADLYYRLRGLQFHLPPLRERREDLPQLLLAFTARAAEKYDKHLRGISRKALRMLAEHDWPGNVRELQDEVENAVLLCPDGEALETSHFAAIRWSLAQRGATAPVTPAPVAEPAPPPDKATPTPTRDLRGQMNDLERRAIAQALAGAGGNKSKAAKALGLTRYGLRLKIKRLGI